MKLTPTRTNALKGLSTKRVNRLIDDVAPLVAQGLTSREIASRLGIHQTCAAKDIRTVKELWADEYGESEICAIRGEAVARADWIWKTSVEAWMMSKASGQPCGKFLDSALAAMRDKVKLSGAEVDLKLIQQNVNVTMATAEQVMNTFEPMNTADFKAFAAAHTEAQMKASAAARAILPEKPVSVESHESNAVDWTGADEADGPEDHRDQQGKNRKVSHPMR